MIRQIAKALRRIDGMDMVQIDGERITAVGAAVSVELVAPDHGGSGLLLLEDYHRIGQLPGEPKIKWTARKAIASAGGSTLRVPRLDDDSDLSTPAPVIEDPYSRAEGVDIAQLTGILADLEPAAGNDLQRLAGVHLGDGAATATDGYTMRRRDTPWDLSTPEPGTVPASLARILPLVGERGTVQISDRWIEVTGPGGRVCGLLMDTRFPDIAAVIPTGDPLATWTPGEQVARDLARSVHTTVAIEIKDGQAILSSDDGDRQYQAEAGEAAGKDARIGSNAKYLASMLDFASEVAFYGPLSPITFTGPGRLGLIMPVRLQ